LQERIPILRADQSIDEEQRQAAASRVSRETTKVFDLLTHAMKIHLNLGQNVQLNSSGVFVRLETVTIDSMKGIEIRTVGEARLRFPNQSLLGGNEDVNQYYSLRVCSVHSSSVDRTRILLSSPPWNRWLPLDIRRHRKRIILDRSR
jgi:hypothetical protein